MAKGLNGRSWLTRSYNFIDKDPAVDIFRGLYQKEHIKEDDLAALSGLATTTIKNLFGGETRRPQHATLAKMASAMGYEYKLGREEAPDYSSEIPKAKEQRKQYRVHLRLKREREARRER
jgi:transcriptional regulator with XRE-family HTH domain